MARTIIAMMSPYSTAVAPRLQALIRPKNARTDNPHIWLNGTGF